MGSTASDGLEAKEVAVIGAGAAGLVAARELKREGHRVVVFERGDTVGGTWVYTSEVDSGDLLGGDPSRTVVQSSLYKSLRTNLPRESMGFLDYPFTAVAGRDGRRFPSHEEVLAYLSDFAGYFNLMKLIRFRTDVFCVTRAADGRWMVRSRKILSGEEAVDVSEVFDAVVVCSGHHTEPRIAEIPGIERWPGKQIHSHNYRVPVQFEDKVVVLIGDAASGSDISRDIAPMAKEVHISSRSALIETTKRQPGYDNMWLHPTIKSAHEDGKVVFNDGSSVVADVILHCTGYSIISTLFALRCSSEVGFLETNGIVAVDDNRVDPLYKHVFPPSLAPSLSFIGIPWKILPFPLFELQCKWVAGILSEKILLPTEKEMMEDVEAFYSRIEAAGYPKRYTHNMSGNQFEYDDWLAMQCGCPMVEDWRKGMHEAASENRGARPETYRDEWDDHDLVLQAQEDFLSLEKLKIR